MKNRIPELRKKMGVSQAELAEKLSVSRQTINSIEVERYTPSLDLAMAIARLFKKTVEEVFTDEKAK
jgi:putative transcriptional regulator